MGECEAWDAQVIAAAMPAGGTPVSADVSAILVHVDGYLYLYLFLYRKLTLAGQQYATLLSLAYRQVTAACKAVWNPKVVLQQ
jgi:hypothetical protein